MKTWSEPSAAPGGMQDGVTVVVQQNRGRVFLFVCLSRRFVTVLDTKHPSLSLKSPTVPLVNWMVPNLRNEYIDDGSYFLMGRGCNSGSGG